MYSKTLQCHQKCLISFFELFCYKLILSTYLIFTLFKILLLNLIILFKIVVSCKELNYLVAFAILLILSKYLILKGLLLENISSGLWRVCICRHMIFDLLIQLINSLLLLGLFICSKIILVHQFTNLCLLFALF